MRTPATLFLTQLTATLFMTGLIWFIQIVHYPLFAAVDAASFTHYESLHATRTTWVVFPPMLLELLTATAALYLPLRASFVPAREAWLSAALVGLIWASTALIQVPLHNHLGEGQDLRTIHQLVQTNWIRTTLWTVRSILLLSQLSRALPNSSF